MEETKVAPPATFADYKKDKHRWISLANGDFYPLILAEARLLYTPVLERFGEALRSSNSSEDLFRNIMKLKQDLRIQLLRVFRRYVSPATSVEMLKKKMDTETIIKEYGKDFRLLEDVLKAFDDRPIPDDPMCVLLWEYKDTGKKGYDLTESFFELFQALYPDFTITGPKRAGKDVLVGTIFKDYSTPGSPVDFVIYDTDGKTVLAIGLARYDGDRGGSQEDDRIGQYKNTASEILGYASTKKLPVKIIFLNDGPGMLLGSMWDDYAQIEKDWAGRAQIVTLKMVPERITREWLLSPVEF